MSKAPFQARLWVLIAALLVVASGATFGLCSAWNLVQQLETKLTRSQIERFQIASEVRRELQSLNGFILRYALLRDPKLWLRFDQSSSDLNHWIDKHDPSMNLNSPLTTDEERRLFQELNRIYDDYLVAAGNVHSNQQPALVTPEQLAQLDAFNLQAERLRVLIRQLNEAHRSAESAFFAKAKASFAILSNILVASGLLLLVLLGAIGWVIYRDTIAPLRTKLVQSQNLLERQQKLATLGTLAAGIAHEIRNPLTSLKARLYTLEKHLEAVPAARKDTNIISSEVSRLEHIVQEVLKFSRPSELQLETLAADAVIREVQSLVGPDLASRGVQLVVETSPPLRICADSGHLKQVLINLVRNGAEAIVGSGTVRLRARSMRTMLAGRMNEAVIIEVTDTGQGISPEVEKRLFDPFFTTKETGTGLGLSIAARIVEKHGGVLQYRTVPGYGTTFGVVMRQEINDDPIRAI